MTDLATIYRVEDDRGRGLYGSNTCDQTEENESIWIKAIPVQDLWGDENHIMPHADGLKDLPRGYRYGFKNLEQLKKWIHKPEWLVGLHEMGGIIKKIQVPQTSVLYGGNQVAYDSGAVVVVSEMSLLSI